MLFMACMHISSTLRRHLSNKVACSRAGFLVNGLHPPHLPPSPQVAMSFQASPQASAVQWLKPEQTAGKKHPYLFTQVRGMWAAFTGIVKGKGLPC